MLQAHIGRPVVWSAPSILQSQAQIPSQPFPEFNVIDLCRKEAVVGSK